MMVLKERWPQFVWSSISSEKKQNKREPIVDHKTIYVPLAINAQTLPGLVRDRITLYYTDSEQTGLLTRCMTERSSVMAEVR